MCVPELFDPELPPEQRIARLEEWVTILTKHVRQHLAEHAGETEAFYQQQLEQLEHPTAVCPECGKTFMARGGVTLHRTKMHPA